MVSARAAKHAAQHTTSLHDTPTHTHAHLHQRLERLCGALLRVQLNLQRVHLQQLGALAQVVRPVGQLARLVQLSQHLGRARQLAQAAEAKAEGGGGGASMGFGGMV